MIRILALLASGLLILSACATPIPIRTEHDPRLQVGIMLLDRVYNSELMAPIDVFQHTIFHSDPGMRVFTIGRSKAPVLTFEGQRILPDYDLDDAPPIDVLVMPSTEHSMGKDLEDQRLLRWLRERGQAAQYLLSVCDGAFPFAEAGLLDGLECTTFPGDIDKFRARYPHLTVHEGVIFVADGKVITGAGGARSYDPAFYLVEKLYGRKVAERIGRGLVIDWKLSEVAHSIGPRAKVP